MSTNSEPAIEPRVEEDELRSLARTQVERRHRLKLRTSAYVIGVLVLTPVWVVTEYLRAGGWPDRLSHNGNPGDWSPWIVWVALAWGFYVVMTALAIRFRRPPTEAELEREVEKLRGSAR